jgi:hypothetical protein
LREKDRPGIDGLITDKGADHYLRNVGYWDIAPIDIHEKRLLLRTGIFHRFSSKKEGQDPLETRSLQKALTWFCRCCLNGKTVEGIDLSCSPGIVDLLIWFYCSDEKHNICGKVPKCNQCQLAEVCFLHIAEKQQPSQPQCAREKGAAEPQVRQVSQPRSSAVPAPTGVQPGVQYRQFQSTLGSDKRISIPNEHLGLFPPPPGNFNIETNGVTYQAHIVGPHGPSDRSHFHLMPFFKDHQYLKKGDVVTIRVIAGAPTTCQLVAPPQPLRGGLPTQVPRLPDARADV